MKTRKRKDKTIITTKSELIPAGIGFPLGILKYIKNLITDPEFKKSFLEIMRFRLKLRISMIRLILLLPYTWMMGGDIERLNEIYQMVKERQKIIKERNTIIPKIKIVRRKIK